MAEHTTPATTTTANGTAAVNGTTAAANGTTTANGTAAAAAVNGLAANGAAQQQVDTRPLMAGFPTGVSVLTTLDEDATPRGMTCSSLASVALTPPTLVVCVRTSSPTLEKVLASGQFALNLLHEGARPVSDLFATVGADRFEQVRWRLPLGAGGPHLSDDAHAIADCRIVQTDEFGDHTAVFARVERVTLAEDPRPLMYGLRRYGRWSDAAAVPPPPPAPAAAPLRSDRDTAPGAAPAPEPVTEVPPGVLLAGLTETEGATRVRR